MQLIQAKVRCVEGVRDSGWFVPGREVTVIHGAEGSGKSALLKALEVLNPVYDIDERQPFANHPEVWHQGEHTRRVIPEKKTAVVMVFAAEPQIVRALDEIDPTLIETDRIEVGRRLDYSRWIIFVEIAASTRWSEIADEMSSLARLQEQVDGEDAEKLSSLWEELSDLKSTDRVKGDTATICSRWLHSLLPYLDEDNRDIAKECLFRVKRAERFKKAREKVRQWLPRSIRIGFRENLAEKYEFSSSATGQEHAVIPLLLEKVREQFKGNRSELKEQFHESESRMRQLLPADVSCPTIDLQDDCWVIGNVASSGGCTNRIQLISLVSILAEIYYQNHPLLLLEQPVDDLADQSTATMIEWLQKFGSHNQLIVTTSQARVSSAGGWQVVKHIGSEGLLEVGLEDG